MKKTDAVIAAIKELPKNEGLYIVSPSGNYFFAGLLTDDLTALVTENEKMQELLDSVYFPLRTKRGDIVERPVGKYRGINLKYKHIKGVFNSPIEAFEALGETND